MILQVFQCLPHKVSQTNNFVGGTLKSDLINCRYFLLYHIISPKTLLVIQHLLSLLDTLLHYLSQFPIY